MWEQQSLPLWWWERYGPYRGLQIQTIEVEICIPENPSFFNQACLGQCTCLFWHVHRILWFPTQLEVSNSVWTMLTPGSVMAPVTSAYIAVLMTPDDGTDWLSLHSVQTSQVTTVDLRLSSCDKGLFEILRYLWGGQQQQGQLSFVLCWRKSRFALIHTRIGRS